MRAGFLALIVVLALPAAAGAQTATYQANESVKFGFGAGPVTPGGLFARSPADQLFAPRANAADNDSGPKLGPEGGGTPSSRGGVGDTLTGYAQKDAPFIAPPPAAKTTK